ncbi:MAG: hypothetical protein ACRKGH_03130 [Dehalogenimonas sp.]
MWAAGFATGLAVGVTLGMILTRNTSKEKSPEQVTKEKKAFAWLVIIGILFVIAIFANLLLG